MHNLLEQLETILNERKLADPETSYVAQLNAKGLNKILEKVGEEATEVILAAKDTQLNANNRQEVIAETADLWFHCLVMLNNLNISQAEVMQELARRMGISGIEEKASRNAE